MQMNSLRQHLRPYSIYQRRKTTINHAFASALAWNDSFDEIHIAQAIRSLGQDPTRDLICVYCDERPATTWDHIEGLVKEGMYSGFGHTTGNLVPCCSTCNSKKGNKPWRKFISEMTIDHERKARKIAQLEEYQARYGGRRFGYNDIEAIAPEETKAFHQVRDQILALMQEADIIASKIRNKIRATS